MVFVKNAQNRSPYYGSRSTNDEAKNYLTSAWRTPVYSLQKKRILSMRVKSAENTLEYCPKKFRLRQMLPSDRYKDDNLFRAVTLHERRNTDIINKKQATILFKKTSVVLFRTKGSAGCPNNRAKNLTKLTFSRLEVIKCIKS
jgi:hypothetical protein